MRASTHYYIQVRWPCCWYLFLGCPEALCSGAKQAIKFLKAARFDTKSRLSELIFHFTLIFSEKFFVVSK